MVSKRSSAMLNIGKVIAEIVSITAAAAYGTHGDVLLAGIATFAGAGITAYEEVRTQIKQLRVSGEQNGRLELLAPAWWDYGPAYWEGFCEELYGYLPAMFQVLTEKLQQQTVPIRGVVQATFIKICKDTLCTEHFTWSLSAEEQDKMAPFVAIPILGKLGELLNEEIKRIQHEHQLLDIHATAANTEEMVSLLRQQQLVLSESETAGIRREYLEKLTSRHRETWAKARGTRTHLTKTELTKILRPLAFWMHEHPEVGAIPLDELTEQVLQQFRERGITGEEAERRTGDFLQTVRGETGILIITFYS